MKPRQTLAGLFGAALLLLNQPAIASAPQPTDILNETPAQRDARMAWFRDARFGMFIHWGVYSVPAGEWKDKTGYGEWFLEETHMPVSQYEKFADQFNPVKFDAKAWVKAAKDAGMKYIVITSKHHDGFGLWDSKLTDWDIARTPFKRDPLKELAAECRKAGIKFCLYHSIMDWHHPDWGQRRAWNDLAANAGPPDMDRYTAYMKWQLKELLTGYGPLGLLWFDGEWESPWTNERGLDVYRYVRSLQPDLIVNNRIGKGRSGMQGMDKDKGVGDYGTPEQEIPATGFGPGMDWESCMTMNGHWGFNKADHDWKSAQTLVRNLIDCASKGGNYLLNVGPTAEGEFPDASIGRLKQIGAWMKVNHTAIYGTTASPFKRLAWGRCTTKLAGKTTTLYLHVFDWPASGKLGLPGLKNPVLSATLLATGSQLTVATNATGVIVSLPAAAPDALSTTVVLKIKGAPEVVTPIPIQSADGSVQLPAIEATTHGHLRYEVGDGKDNIGHWTNPEDWVEWQFKATQPGKMEVTAEIAAADSGKFILELAGQKLEGASPITGSYTKFQLLTLGTLDSAAGDVTLTVRPITEGWHPMNLKSVTLTPVK